MVVFTINFPVHCTTTCIHGLIALFTKEKETEGQKYHVTGTLINQEVAWWCNSLQFPQKKRWYEIHRSITILSVWPKLTDTNNKVYPSHLWYFS